MAAVFLTVILAGFVAVIWAVFDEANIFDSEEAASLADLSAFVLAIIGVLLLVAGVFFLFVEAKQPPEPKTAGEPGGSGRGVADPTGLVKGVADGISGHRGSVALLALGFVLVLLSAAGSGLIEVSVGSDGDAPTATTEVPATTVP